MHRRCLIFVMLLIGAGLRAGEVLDRVVAVVNGHALLQSDWDTEVRYECFMSGRSLADLSPQDRKNALDRLIDQELLSEQMHFAEFKPAPAEEVDKQLQVFRSEYAHKPEAWNAALATYQIGEGVLRDHIGQELNLLRLVDARLRPSVQIDFAEVESYYKQEFIPKLSDQQMTLKEAEPKIRELLTQQKMNELLNSWLDSLRSQARIQSFTPELIPPQVHTQ